mmetsp:Transcript_7443/g.22963  ORF Transcript_7443/g.22963 Transcript_7443/m.22963 type:complete len:298 (+) Transcript_7443:48-941(+)
MFSVIKVALLCLTGAALRPGGLPGRRSPRLARTATYTDATPGYRYPPPVPVIDVGELLPPIGVLPVEVRASALAYSVYSAYGALTSNGVDLRTGTPEKWACALILSYYASEVFRKNVRMQRLRDPVRRVAKVLNKRYKLHFSYFPPPSSESKDAAAKVKDFVATNPSGKSLLLVGDPRRLLGVLDYEFCYRDRVLCIPPVNDESFREELGHALCLGASVNIAEIAFWIRKTVASAHGVRPVTIIVDLELSSDAKAIADAFVDVQKLKMAAGDSVVILAYAPEAPVRAAPGLEIWKET